MDTFPCEYPGNGLGDYREGAIEIVDDGGYSAVGLTYDGYEINDGKPRLTGLPATFENERSKAPSSVT